MAITSGLAALAGQGQAPPPPGPRGSGPGWGANPAAIPAYMDPRNTRCITINGSRLTSQGGEI
jgi:hypothetical protein